MKLVYKCNWCTVFWAEKYKEQGKVHEKNCEFNPNNKTCYTCKNHRAEFLDLVCDAGVEASEVQKNCKHWKMQWQLENKCLKCGNTLRDDGKCGECDED